MIAEGTIYPGFVLATIAVALAYTMLASKSGKVFELRKLPAIEALEEAVGRAVEMGGPVHWCMGTGRGRPLTRVAGSATASFLILQRLAHLCAKLGARLLPTVGQAEAITVVDSICSEAYLAENQPDGWDAENIGFYPDAAYKIGVPGRLSKEEVKSNIMVGTFVSEAIIIAETGAGVGAFQIGGTTAWNNIAYFVTSCNYVLIGEEIYSAGAYLTDNPVERSTVIGQDIAKVVLIAITLLGILLKAAGIEVITNLMKL
jgi:hypothetical protein